MTAYVYLEGGGDSKGLRILCQRGFRELLESAGYAGKMPRLVACGGRASTYDDFKTAHLQNKAEYVAMLIDSEDPVADIEKTWEHLKKRDKWDKPAETNDEQVLFMTTCMETLIAADPEELNEHYGSDLQESALPPISDLETRTRDDVQTRLERATRNCKNCYQKGKRSFEILGKLNPVVLVDRLPSFKRIKRILDARLLG